MIQIKTKGEALDLPSGFSIEIEDSNPIFNDRGSQSIPVTVPATRRNIRLLDAPHRMDAGTDPNLPERSAEVIAGAYIRRGTMNVTEAGKEEGITFNIGFDNSTAYAKWSKKKLSELSGLPVFYPPKGQEHDVERLLDELYRIYRCPDLKDEFAVFPLALNNESTGSDNYKKVYWEVLNLVGDHGLAQPGKVRRLIDGEVTEVSIPEGYMVTPFLRVWRVLELVFNDLGLTVLSNPFKPDSELWRLVVLNNAADSVCTGKIKYADLMPDSTVEEFLNALWVRFGLVYNIDENKHTVNLRFLSDILECGVSEPLDRYIAGIEKITYNERQYVKLSAKTSIEGAEPSHERFEDFIKGLDVSKVHLGASVSQWKNTGNRENPHWDGDYMDGYYDDYNPWDDDPDYPGWEPPDPWDDYWDRDDDYDDGRDYYAAPRRAPESRAGASVENDGNTFLAREFVTGTWYKLDSDNSRVRLSSSSFFNWDPQPEGCSALELTSDDECIPVQMVSTVTVLTGHSFTAVCPLYLFGARHYHSYIKGSEDTENSGDSTPLAFLFAYTKDNMTFGRTNPEGWDGMPLKLDDGSRPTISLLFQFKDGLFAKFWKKYDEILRHGNRSVDVKCRVDKMDLPGLDMFSTYSFKGVRVLLDTVAYTLPSGRHVATDLKLRTVQTHGNYDISKEQSIPDFSAATRHLEWRVLSDSFGTDGSGLDSQQAKQQAADNYISCNDYRPHGSEGDYYYVGARGAMFVSAQKMYPTWLADSTLPKPQSIQHKLTRTYKATLTYNIFEIHDLTHQGDEYEDWELSEEPIGQDEALVDYTVVLVPYWVND